MDITSSPRSAQLLPRVLVLLLAAGPLCWVHSAPAPPHDLISSGEELGDDSSSSSPAISNSESLAKLIQGEAAKLREELCSKHGVCDNSMELLMRNHLRLPTIVPEDGCFLSGFRKEKCLHKIHHDLVEFQTYFLYLEETFTSEKNLVESIRYSARSLAGTVKMMMKRPNALSDHRQTQKVSLADLQSEDLWIQKVTSRLILHSFIDFMQKTARAVRFVGTFHVSKQE